MEPRPPAHVRVTHPTLEFLRSAGPRHPDIGMSGCCRPGYSVTDGPHGTPTPDASVHIPR
jgi:hypothetical protein